MPWPLIKLVPQKTNFRFVRFAAIAGVISVLAVLATFASIVSGGFRENPIALYQNASGGPLEKVGGVLSHGFALGIDFQGGTLIEIDAPSPIDVGALRSSLSDLELGDIQVQLIGGQNSALVRFQAEGVNPTEAVAQVQQHIRSVVPEAQFSRTEVVGPKMSSELLTSGVMALGLAIVLMLVYIWFRFEWQFGIGAVFALFHDTILTLGLFSVFRIEFTLTIIAAVLTIIGYSMNDTVVVFDRLRENLRKYKRMPLKDVIDLSTNETLSRTLVTSVTALLAAVALWVFGGETLRGFAIAMVFGIVIGTYSSIYVAAPALLLFHVKRGGDASPAATPVPQTSS
jgi:preprotein translocase SecF subunit